MGVLGFVLGTLGVMTVVASVNGRLPLILAAIFGQSPPIAPSYNSLQQQPAQPGWTSDAGIAGAGSAGSF